MTLPTTESGYPETAAFPVFLQDILRELYQHSLAEGHAEMFRDACKKLKEIIPETECPHRPYTIAWQLWFRGFTRGFTEGYIRTVVTEKATNAGKARRNIARAMLNHGYDRHTVMKMTGLTEDDLAQIRH
ncbi:hypothetical protein DOA20_24725 [Salmonella enterica subsp. enterica serovar Newport]|nr:hypothetical protein [Salmonella enterica subsp. enterica serovar Newport]